ncbi:MAG: hypothetical protein K2N55_04120 [Lachnospiraceae bacterium]|nr:hypothetical protein [Lachnospiraceae bacterium]
MNDTSMNFTSFTQSILKDLQKKLGDNYSVFSHNVKKNNGIELTGIVAKRKGCNTSPTIYINDLYKPDITPKEAGTIADMLYDHFQAAEFDDDLDMSGFVEFDKAKEKLAFKLVHAEKNKELLKLIPHKVFHNLAIVFYYTVQEAPFYGRGAILVYNTHMKQWEADLDILYKIAFENTPILFPSIIENMQDVMRSILMDGLEDDLLGTEGVDEDFLKEVWEQEVGETKMPMYVLTNKQKLYGAACMLYPGALKGFAEKINRDFYILPSSVHEVILVPADTDTDREALCEIVTEINRTQVAEEEILADSVYFYSKNLDKVLWIL